MVSIIDLVYVVDDDASVRNAVRRLLKSAHYSVMTFASAEEFWQSEFKSVPGCLLLDIMLPGISGFELQEKLLDKGHKIPVIFVTGQDRPGMQQRALGLGAIAYLKKPIDEETLLESIRLAMKSLEGTAVQGGAA